MESGHGQTAAPLLAGLDFEGRRVLDLGTGNGWAVQHARDHRAVLAVGVDLSRNMVLRAGGSGRDATQADFTHLPFPDATFDLVWSMEAIYYARDPDAVLKEVLRVLEPGGVFHMLIDHYQENPASHDWPHTTGVRMVLRSELEWVAAFTAAGFQGVEADRLRAEKTPETDLWKYEQGSLHITGRR